MSRHRSLAGLLAMTLATVLVAGCASGGGKTRAAQPLMNPADADFFVPASAFDARGDRDTPLPAALPAVGATAKPFRREVLVYFSPTSRRLYREGHVNADFGMALWERFLKKYGIPYRVLEGIEDLARADSGVLVLPANVALTDREKVLISGFRQQGGSLFASWATGVRDGTGAWQGFEWMEALLGIRIAGDTRHQEEDRYINPAGDRPVTHSLPAGTRIWTERATGWYPLRVAGAESDALLLGWSRTRNHDQIRPQGALAHGEALMPSGARSRMVFSGWPERLWMAADARKHEGILYDSLMWLLRQPAAYLGTWPHPYRSAYAPIIYMADVFNENDLPFAENLKAQGLVGSYFILGFEIGKSAPTLRKIHALGHELGYEADEYEGFKGLPPAQQGERLDAMRAAIRAEKLPVAEDAGFNPPMDDIDPVTIAAAAARPFSYMVGWIDGTDGCLPYFHAGDGSRAKPMVMLPRIQRGVEEMLEDFDEDDALANHLAELEAGQQLGCLNMPRFANQSLVSSGATGDMLAAFDARRAGLWSTSGRGLADWWRERARISVALSGTAEAPVLEIRIAGDGPIRSPAVVWLDLPESGQQPQLTATTDSPGLRLAPDGPARVALLLEGLPAGQHRWAIRFASHPDPSPE